MKFSNELLAENIRANRARADISQAELAERIGVNSMTVGRYECASIIPGTDKLVAIATALHTTPNELIGWATHE